LKYEDNIFYTYYYVEGQLNGLTHWLSLSSPDFLPEIIKSYTGIHSVSPELHGVNYFLIFVIAYK